jgi:hypothetical protein
METNRRGFLIGLGAIVAAPAIVRASSLMPVKVLRPEPIEAWIPCDGRLLSRTRYADLFRNIGTTFGIGDGITTFNLPDLRGRIIGHDAPLDLVKIRPVALVEKRIATTDGPTGHIVAGQIYDFWTAS